MRRYTHKKVFPYSSLVTQHLLAYKVKKHEWKHNELDIKPIILTFFWSENINLIDTSKISQSCSITESGWFARSTCVPHCLKMLWKIFVNGTGSRLLIFVTSFSVVKKISASWYSFFCSKFGSVSAVCSFGRPFWILSLRWGSYRITDIQGKGILLGFLESELCVNEVSLR